MAHLIPRDVELCVTLTNETEGGVIFSDLPPMPLHHMYLAEIDGGYPVRSVFAMLQEEYGVCRSAVYVDRDDRTVRHGWYFESREEYTDTHEPYLRGAWCTLRYPPVPVAPVPFDLEGADR